jgi:hypothetical protein
MILPAGQGKRGKGFAKMKTKILFLLVLTILNAAGAAVDTAQIDQLTGLKGKFNEKGGAYKISFPREDITVLVDGWKIPAFMGLRTWAAFAKATHSEAMVMGDTVLLEDEVNLAMRVALESGLSVTALLLVARWGSTPARHLPAVMRMPWLTETSPSRKTTCSQP